ncbi:MAG: YezD family protein [Clostridiales bacterium]|nr:YezD family protein [Clostridiales bacterium]
MVIDGDGTRNDEWYIDEIRKQISTIRYGSLNIIIQDGKVIQIEKTEKFRQKN